MPVESIAIAYDCLYPHSTGGGERLYRSYAETMVRRSRRVDYLTAEQWDGEPDPASFGLIAVTKRLNLYDAAGVRRSSTALVFAWGLFRALRRRQKAYDAIVVSGLPVLNVFAVRAALIGSRTLIVVDFLEVWGRDQWTRYAGRLTGTIAWVLQRAAIALTPTATCHSALTARQLRAEGFRGRLLVSPGLIEGRVEHDNKRSARAEPPYVLYAGRHIADKQVEVLPAAVAKARETLPDLRLIVLGSGPATPTLRAEIERLHAHAWTELPGFVAQDRLDDLMAHAVCLANPSRREGYGLVVVEASAHGTPVVLVDHPENAATELVDEGVNGFIARSATADDISEAILRAAAGGDALRATTREWYDDAVRTRTVERTVDGILAALDDARNDDARDVARRSIPEEGHP